MSQRSSAVLWRRELASGLVELTLDCRHAVTTAMVFAPPGSGEPLTEDQAIRIAQERHEATCRCGRRYVTGVSA